MSTRRIKVTAPIVQLDGPWETIHVMIGGRKWRLVGDGDDKDARGFACAIHMAKSVTLEIEEHPRFTAPEDKT